MRAFVAILIRVMLREIKAQRIKAFLLGGGRIRPCAENIGAGACEQLLLQRAFVGQFFVGHNPEGGIAWLKADAEGLLVCQPAGMLHHQAAAFSIASSSSINPSIMPRPICQKPGSLASRPNGFSKAL